MRFSRLELVLLTLLSIDSAAFEGKPAATLAPLSDTATIHYREGKLSAHFVDRPLIGVLRDISVITGARFRLNDPQNGQALVSAQFDERPFRDGVRTILDGFSYAIYPLDQVGIAVIVVLSTPQTDHLAVSSHSLSSAPDGDPLETMAGQPSEREDVVNQAIVALGVADRPVSQQTLDQLVGVREDPRATEALAQAASAARDSGDRVRATEALWHHAADLQFGDQAAVSALERLSGDADREVGKTASQALADMQQFRRNDRAP